jgi:DDE domain
MLSETRDMAAAKAFFQSAKTVTGITPARMTTDGHDSYPRAIRTELGEAVRHRTDRYLNNRIEQDHRGIKGRYQPMRGFKDSSHCVDDTGRPVLRNQPPQRANGPLLQEASSPPRSAWRPSVVPTTVFGN